MTFTESVATMSSKYATFSGRASRSEFWWMQLAWVLMIVAAATLDVVLNTKLVFYCIVAFGGFLPLTAVQVRRLHDIGKSGWNLLWILVPLVGSILVLVFFCTAGTSGPNEYGQDPL